MISVICMSRRLSSFLRRLSVNSSRNATPRHSRCKCQREIEIVSLDSAVDLLSDALRGRPPSKTRCVLWRIDFS